MAVRNEEARQVDGYVTHRHRLRGDTGIFSKTPEELAAKEEAAAKKRARREAEAFAATPAGQARTARAEGAGLFQFSIDLESTSASSGLGMADTTTTTVTERWYTNGSREATAGTVLATYVFERS